MLLPSVSRPLFLLKPVLRSVFASLFCHLFKFILLFWFLMLLGMLFLNFSFQNYESVLPAIAGSTFPQDDFYQRRVHDEVSVPKMVSKPSLWGGSFHCVLLQNISFCRLSRKWPVWEVLFSITCTSHAFWMRFS